MSYESAKTSTNLGSGETMTSDMPSQPTANNFYANNNSRAQAMMMNPMMTGNNYYNGPQQGAPSQQNQMPNRPMYQGYPPGAAPPPPHPQHHQILSPFDTCEPRANTYYSSYPHETGVYEHQPQTMGRNYYGNYHEHHMEGSPYASKDPSLSSTTNTNNDTNTNDSTTTSHEQHQSQNTSMGMQAGQTPTGNGNYANPSMMPPPHAAAKQQQQYGSYSQPPPGDMYIRGPSNPGASAYMPQYPQYPTGGPSNMNPRSPAPNPNSYRPSYPVGSYQNGISSPSSSGPTGKPGSRSQQLSPKCANSQPTTPPQQPRYQSPYPSHPNGPIGYKPVSSNGYAPPPSQPMNPQQQPGSSWLPPSSSSQRDVTTPSLASSAGDSDSNSSSASQQNVSYPPTAMTNGPNSGAYPPVSSGPYHPSAMADPNNATSSTAAHSYMDQQYSNMPPQNYNYSQQMNQYGNHPQQQPTPPQHQQQHQQQHPQQQQQQQQQMQTIHGSANTEFRPPASQPMDDENNPYRSKGPQGTMIDTPSQQSSVSQPQSIQSSTNGPKSPSGTSMSSYVPDDGDSSDSSFADSPPSSHEKGQSKRKSSTTSSSHGTPAEVFSKLREMGDEAEKQDRNLFVDRLQKLWEEYQVVCRNLPTISKQTIDLYRLYTYVREQNGFQEFSKVAKNRHWRDIATKLNIPNSSSAAFNVKQKYINLKLFHYECKYDRGGINPEPILADLDKQPGKRTKTPKKGNSNSGSTMNNSNENTNDGKVSSNFPPSVHTQGQNPMLGQQPNQPQPGQDPYRCYQPPPNASQGHPHPMVHPSQPYRPMQMPMHPYGPSGGEMQPGYDTSTSGQMMYNTPDMDYQRAGYPPGQQGPSMMKTPSNAYGMPPQNSQVPQPPGPMGSQHRPPGPYPSIASKPQQPQQMGPSMTTEYNGQPASNAPGTAATQPNPSVTGGPQQTYHYQPQQMTNMYPPPGGFQQRPPTMPGGSVPPQPHDPYMSQQPPPNQNYQSSAPTTYSHKKTENATPETSNIDHQDPHKGNKLLMNQLRAPTNTSTIQAQSPISMINSPHGAMSPAANHSHTTSAIGPTITTTATFPPNSVEATTIPPKMKRKKLTAKDVTPVDPWKLMMSLRGGLLAETTWALDTINIMLSDDQTHTHFRLKQMPGLLPAIVDIYVKCLTQLFDEFKASPANIENQQPSLEELNGSSHLTCTTLKKCDYRQQEAVVYRVESNYLNKYRRKYQKQQSIVYDRVCDEQGNEKKDPTDALDLQNTDDLCYIRTHFDPFRTDDRFFENLYYGKHIEENSKYQNTEEHDQVPMENGHDVSRKRTKTCDGDMLVDDINNTVDNNKRRRHDSDGLTEISDSNKEFLERYKRRFEYDERQSYDLYPGISLSTLTLTKQTPLSKSADFDSCADASEQHENASSLFSYHSLAYDQICARCTCVSSILRNLSFILGNDIELVKSKTLIGLLARLLLLRHGINHNHASDSHSSLDETVNPDQVKNDEIKSSPSFSWVECVLNIRENTLVTLANIAGVLVLDTLDSDLLYTLIDGLLHWSTCYSGEAIDSLQSPLLSAQRLSIEILTKLSVHEMNMDFVLATPPFYRIVSLFHVLTDWLIVDEISGGISNWHPPTHYYSNLSRPQSHIQREFAIVLLNALTRCDPLATNVVARIPYAISLLINFLEDYEMKMNELMARCGPDYVIRLTTQTSSIPNAEQILFTTSDMLRRAATCLLSIVTYADNIKMMKRYEDRILNLSISHLIDSNVGRVLTEVLHYCSSHNS